MRFINSFTCNSMLEVIISQTEEVRQLNMLDYNDDIYKSKVIQKDLEEIEIVQVYKNFKTLKTLMGRECSDEEWNEKYLKIQSLISEKQTLPNSMDEEVLRAWFYLQLFYIKNNNAEVIGLTQEQIAKLLDLEIEIFNNPNLEELHNLYVEYYKNFVSVNPLPYAHLESLVNFRKAINSKVAESKSDNKEIDTNMKLSYTTKKVEE